MNYNFQRSKFQVQGQKWKVKGQISKRLKLRFFNLSLVAFWASQEPENELKVRLENLNLSFIEFI